MGKGPVIKPLHVTAICKLKVTDDILTTSLDFILTGKKVGGKNQMGGRSECIRHLFVTMHLNSEVKVQHRATVGDRELNGGGKHMVLKHIPRGDPAILGPLPTVSDYDRRSLPIGQQQQLLFVAWKTQQVL